MRSSVIDDLKKKLASKSGRVFVDFDYTLYRSNSTEDFLNCARPLFVAALVLRFLHVFRPWAIGPKRNDSYVWRDPCRIFAILLLMPWTLWLFRRRAQSLFAERQNFDLIELLSEVDPSRIVIVSAGYEAFIRQLLKGSVFEPMRLIAGSLRHPVQLRKNGKLAELERLGVTPDYNQDIVITDSTDDQDVLDAVDDGFLIEPDSRESFGGLREAYVPFFYSARVKRSAEFVVKQIFLEELIIVLLATAFFLPFSMLTWAGTVLLFIAFLTAYEIGYAENDRIGYMVESEPKLAGDYENFKELSLEPAAWVWVVALTAVGMLLLDSSVVTNALDRLGVTAPQFSHSEKVTLGAIWIGVVVVGRVVFYLYNRLPMVWRIFCYVLLHFVKYFGLIIIFPSHPVGYALLCAQIVRTWALYAIRRCGGDMEKMASQTVRLVFFLMFISAIELATPENVVFYDWHTWAILAWCVIRAAPEAKRKLFNQALLQSGMRAKSAPEVKSKIDTV